MEEIMSGNWAVIDNRNLKKIESHWREHRDREFKQSIDGMSIDELRKLALSQNSKIQDLEIGPTSKLHISGKFLDET